MKHILSISFASADYNFDEVITFLGAEIRISQYSTNFDLELTLEIIKKFDGHCDVISINGIPPKLKFEGAEFAHPVNDIIKKAAKVTPVVDGQNFKDVYLPWAFRYLRLHFSKLLNQKKYSFYCGSLQIPLLDVVGEAARSIQLADPYFVTKIPMTFESPKRLKTFIKMASPLLQKRRIRKSLVSDFSISKLKKFPLLKSFLNSDIYVGNENNLSLIDLEHLNGKDVVVDVLGPTLESRLSQAGVRRVFVCLPQVENRPLVNFSILEALIQSKLPDGVSLDEHNILDWMSEYQLVPMVKELKQEHLSDCDRFAFIIHPLSAKYLFKHPYLKMFKNYSAPFENVLEELMSFYPGFYYGNIEGIVSEKNGRKVEGLIYTVTETPRKLLEKDPEVIYSKLLKLCRMASIKGAGIIGLGAYTKIVGDAGVTVAERSPIPVTTGNSLSSASTLWAAKLAVEKLGFVEKNESFFKGTCMIVGATGSIGAVSAKILALTWETVILCAPRPYKLLELKEDILKLNPRAKILIGTDPDAFSSQCDLIITSTSGQGERILDIMKVKSGAVICDVSRPFDIKAEDAVRRPDVMVVASGEVTLPGHTKSNVDLGLEGNLVYACLAETAILAMEGKLECFTLSRNINYEKVLEIDRLAKEHGVRLSQICGHHGAISDEEFLLCREHALYRKQKNGEGELHV